MANLRGRIHALEKKIAKQDAVILELGDELGDTADNLANAQNMVRGLKNPDMLFDGDSLTLDRVQIMENGDIRLLPPPPAPIVETCVQAPEPDKNGKKPEKELVNATAS